MPVLIARLHLRLFLVSSRLTKYRPTRLCHPGNGYLIWFLSLVTINCYVIYFISQFENTTQDKFWKAPCFHGAVGNQMAQWLSVKFYPQKIKITVHRTFLLNSESQRIVQNAVELIYWNGVFFLVSCLFPLFYFQYDVETPVVFLLGCSLRFSLQPILLFVCNKILLLFFQTLWHDTFDFLWRHRW